jgi:hypothetical protein
MHKNGFDMQKKIPERQQIRDHRGRIPLRWHKKSNKPFRLPPPIHDERQHSQIHSFTSLNSRLVSVLHEILQTNLVDFSRKLNPPQLMGASLKSRLVSVLHEILQTNLVGFLRK